jgi:hypothetical protein
MSDDERPKSIAPATANAITDARLLRSVGNSLLMVKGALDRFEQAQRDNHAATTGQLSSLMTEIKLLGAGINETRRDVEKSADRIREDMTPVHGTPIPTREELAIEISTSGVKASANAIAKFGLGLPWMVLGLLIGMGLLIFALWASGARLLVREQSPMATQQRPPPGAVVSPALPVPQLRPPPPTVSDVPPVVDSKSEKR